MNKVVNWSEAQKVELEKIKMVCFDVDDTVTTDGVLPAASYQALWDLKEAGYLLMPITGRSASWCDHFARFWPVDAVVGENGAFSFFMDNGVRRRIDTLGDKSNEAKEKIQSLKSEILSEFPQAIWASDQDYREYDLAIDICEDVPPWSEDEIQRLLEFLKQCGAKAKLSSIHINAWFGEYDKCSGIKAWLMAGGPGVTGNIPKWDEMIFIGDSPNDAPMFGAFDFSVGVANITKYWDQLEAHPTWVTTGKSGDGFVEMAQKLIQIRQ
ncbi:MAG: HAD-IIB family hydrolase [Bacteriovoracaceae bacterium]|nr:HAD-IIB family hydrolase [Bacteriovoracaceae bacterium]